MRTPVETNWFPTYVHSKAYWSHKCQLNLSFFWYKPAGVRVHVAGGMKVSNDQFECRKPEPFLVHLRTTSDDTERMKKGCALTHKHRAEPSDWQLLNQIFLVLNIVFLEIKNLVLNQHKVLYSGNITARYNRSRRRKNSEVETNVTKRLETPNSPHLKANNVTKKQQKFYHSSSWKA